MNWIALIMAVGILKADSVKLSDLYFYTYGSLRCSHCRMLKSRLDTTLEKGHFVFRSITEDSNQAVLLNLYKMFHITVIPVTAIFEGDTLRVIQAGDFQLDGVLPLVVEARRKGCVLVNWSKKEFVCDNETVRELQSMLSGGIHPR